MSKLRHQVKVSIYHDQCFVQGTIGDAKQLHNLHTDKNLALNQGLKDGFWKNGGKYHKKGKRKTDRINFKEKCIRKCLNYPSPTYYI